MIDFLIKVMEILGIVGACTAILTGIIVLFKGGISALIVKWLDRQFLKTNTDIVGEIQDKFNKGLADYKLTLDQNLVSYKGSIDEQIARQIESLKAVLGKSNIAFQITHTEYVKRQFNHIEELHSLIFQLYRYVLLNYTFLKDTTEDEYRLINVLAEEKRSAVIFQLNNTSFFLPEATTQLVFKYLDDLHKLIIAHEEYKEERWFVRNGTLPNSPERKKAISDAYISKENFTIKMNELDSEYNEITNELRKLVTSSLS